jgi:hypothetical protein
MDWLDETGLFIFSGSFLAPGQHKRTAVYVSLAGLVYISSPALLARRTVVLYRVFTAD